MAVAAAAGREFCLVLLLLMLLLYVRARAVGGSSTGLHLLLCMDGVLQAPTEPGANGACCAVLRSHPGHARLA